MRKFWKACGVCLSALAIGALLQQWFSTQAEEKSESVDWADTDE